MGEAGERDDAAARLTDKLKAYGLTPTEAKVYLYLSKLGEGTAIEVAKRLNIQRTEIYAILRALQNKGIVVCTMRRPAKFVAVPLDRALGLLIDSEKMRLRSMEIGKDELIATWQRMSITLPREAESRFQMLTGTEQAFARIRGLLSEPQSPKMVCCAGSILSKMYYSGVFDVPQSRKTAADGFMVLTEVTPKNRSTIVCLKGMKVRHVQFVQPPSFVINDDSDLVFVLGQPEGQEEAASSAMWSSHKPLVRSMRGTFMKLWDDALDLDEVPLEPTKGFLAPQLARKETSRQLTSVKTAFKELLREAGYRVVEGSKFAGSSGANHLFDIFAETTGNLPMVIDVSGGEFTEVEVLRMYAKVRDLPSIKAKAVLAVKGRASEKARELAQSYGIRLLEI